MIKELKRNDLKNSSQSAGGNGRRGKYFQDLSEDETKAFVSLVAEDAKERAITRATTSRARFLLIYILILVMFTASVIGVTYIYRGMRMNLPCASALLSMN